MNNQPTSDIIAQYTMIDVKGEENASSLNQGPSNSPVAEDNIMNGHSGNSQGRSSFLEMNVLERNMLQLLRQVARNPTTK